MTKKILMIGNKPTDKLNFNVDDYDIIVMVNRMQNLHLSERVDWWYLDTHEGLYELYHPTDDEVDKINSTVKEIVYPHNHPLNLEYMLNKGFTMKCKTTDTLLCSFFGVDMYQYFTSDVICLLWLVLNYGEVDFTCLDIDNRNKIMRAYKFDGNRNWHCYQNEEEIMKSLIEKGRIHYVE